MWEIIQDSRSEYEVAEAMPAGKGVLVRTIICDDNSNSVALCFVPDSYIKIVSTDPNRVTIEPGLAP